MSLGFRFAKVGALIALARDAFMAERAHHHLLPEAIDGIALHGAFEISLRALVVDGGIYHHAFGASAVIDGCRWRRSP